MENVGRELRYTDPALTDPRHAGADRLTMRSLRVTLSRTPIRIHQRGATMREESIFVGALELLEPTERALYLDRECAGDRELRHRVETLLGAHELSGDLLDPPAAGTAGSGRHVLLQGFDFPAVPGTRPVAEGPGTRIGPYKLLHSIGEGGMGIVFMAEQEAPVRRQVALKVIKPGMDTVHVIARFDAERQALALMDHDHIAKVFDAGATESGRPFFVMELVRGVPITEYCDKNHLPAEARLALFVSVCRAIQHAHHKGIIHRDIKPSNVMVTLTDGMPVVKIIDFGIAKAIEQRLTEKTLFTAHGQMIGTPAYMSPEQASMSLEDVDTRSDVYSLGVLLYELLTGTTPIEAARLREAGYAEMQRLICAVVPPRPSTRLSSLNGSTTLVADNRATDPKHLSRLLAGDLDWIVMKALEKDRNRRYTSAESFGDDIERYLRRDAILARPPSAVYRLTRFAQRHRVVVVAVAAVTAALVTGTTIATWQAVVATRAKHRALAAATAESQAKQLAMAEKAETQAVLKFVEKQILAAARPKGRDGGLGPGVTLREAIDAAVPFVEKSFNGQPLTEARLRETLGDSYWYLGDGKAAEAQYGPALAILTKVLGPDHRETIQCVIQLGISYGMQGRARDSVKLYEEILPICKARLGTDSRETLQCLNNLAMGLWDLDKHEDAIRIHREVLEIKKAKYGPDDRSTLTTMSNLANGYHSLHRYEDALKLREEIFELFKAKYGPDDNDSLMTMHNLGANLRALGRYADALRLDEETRARRTATLGVDHPDTLTSLWSMAQDLIKLDRGALAVPLLDECLQRAAGKRVHRNFPEVADLRLRHFEKAKNARECRTTAELWEKQKRTDANSMYQAAVCRAVTAAVLREANARDASAASLADDEADRAMSWLHKAVATGYNDVAEIKTGKDFDTLRDRTDFKKLLAKLDKQK
jgi:serine/threonine protein kinase/tetratricopeptide (TPR) repeat protein